MLGNTVKRKLAAGKSVVGIWVGTSDPRLIELCGIAGFDYVVIDAEHSPISERTCEELVRAAEVHGLTSIVRVPDNREKVILRYLDVGALGIIVPQIKSREDAERAVRAARYAPMGQRGMSAGRLSGYGASMNIQDYVERINQETVVILQIEHKQAVDQLAEILAVEGVDAFEIGRADLSQSLGLPGNGTRPEVAAYVQRAVEGILGAGRVLGDTTDDPEEARALLARGYRMVACHLTGVLLKAGKDYLRKVTG